MQGRFKKEGSATGEAGPSGPSGSSPATGQQPHGGEPLHAAGSTDDAAPERVGESPAPETDPAEANAVGSRLAMRNWRISTRLVSLIALPVVAATALGVFRIQDTNQDIEQLDNMQLLTDMTRQATRLATALQEERDRSAGPLIADNTSAKASNIATLRDRTDSARSAFADATLGIDRDDSTLSGISNRVLSIGRQLNQLRDIRDEAYDDPAYISQTVSRYNELIDSLLALSQDMALATSNEEMINSTRALAAFSAAKEYASIQRAMISGGSARGGEGFSGSDWRYGKTAQQNEQASMRSFQQLYGDSAITEPLDGGIANVVSAGQLADRVFDAEDALADEQLSDQDAYDLLRSKVDAMDSIEQTLLAEMERQAEELRDEAQRDAILNGAVIILVLGISLVGAFVVARSMVRSLRRLQDTAQEVAHRRLPEVVRQMSEADPQDIDTSVASVGVHTRDEIGKVAEAFDDVHREAVRLAGEQALLRGNVNAMFTNLSRRSQGLIQRQLSLISELESREADPDQLASLFKLDHLATRMRRNGENLLVLAGEEPGRRWTRPVPLVDVLRAAASEVEQYERIELSAVPKTDVAGRVVNDLVHLLAELLENATSFSSPQTKVKVTGHALPDGRILVEIHDTGIGLSPEDLGEINERLANPPTVDVSVSRRMGLFVVGRLSLRHGIRIQLRPSDSGGTTALVMLPAEVAQTAGRPKPAPNGAAARGAAEPPSATLRRETPPRRQPGDAEVGGPPNRNQMAAPPARAALPSRPGTGRPQEAVPPTGGQPGPAGQPHGAGAPGRPQDRPSWASRGEDTGRIPPVQDNEAPRGHDQGFGGGQYPATDDFSATREFPAVDGGHPAAGALPPGQGRPHGRPGGPGHPGQQPGHDQEAPGGYSAPTGHHGPTGTAEFTSPVSSPGDTGELTGPFGVHQDPHAAQQGQHQHGAYADPHGAQAGPQDGRQHGQAHGYGRPGPGDHQPTTEMPAIGSQQSEASHDLFGQYTPPPQQEQVAPQAHYGAGGPSERTPIFEQVESTWFGARNGAPQPHELPREAPAAPQAPQPPATPSSGPERSAPRELPPSRPEQSAAPAVGSGAAGTGPSWESPNDERWRRAEQLRSPAAGGVTTSGLPRRVPRANLVAGTAKEKETQVAPTGPQVSRSPSDVRGRLTNLRRGIQQGRQAGTTTGGENTGQGLGSPYRQER
ncbi:sensor histidine kinase [Streptomyces lonarensis]|uniref:histidine kinase n=2 Tax=Streptomyces lonarensis TaxID=700599 RepID=A0A7X6D3K7_9ACTN|nr:nitrate- and nitrite sensing domain-containing protein [Streptomyces lonarensis]NJQ07534.1 HAMP domain-containing protein [Streptomyces lonarensis]